MKFGVVNKSTTVNRFVLHTLQRNITRLGVITRKTNIKLGILKGGGKLEKSQIFQKNKPNYRNRVVDYFKSPGVLKSIRVKTSIAGCSAIIKESATTIIKILFPLISIYIVFVRGVTVGRV